MINPSTVKIIIIEKDEKSIEFLIETLPLIHDKMEISSIYYNFKDAIEGISDDSPYDLVIMAADFHDRMALKLLDVLKLRSPIIFLGSDYHHTEKLISYNMISYLTKPLHKSSLKASLAHYFDLKDHFTRGIMNTRAEINHHLPTYYKRFIGKRGIEYYCFSQEDIVCFYVESRVVFMLCRNGQKYMTEYASLSDLQASIDQRLFFKANRKYLVNLVHIKKYITYQKVRIKLELEISTPEELIVSQESAQQFRKWIRCLS